MKHTLLLLMLLPLYSFSQVGFGVKTGVNLSYHNFEDVGITRMNPSYYFGGFLEYKSDVVGVEFGIDYSPTESDAKERNISGITYSDKLEVQSLITSLSLKLYPVEKFVVKTGIYLNSSNTDYTFNGEDIEADMKDVGMMLGMEAYVYKGLFLDGRILFDLNKKDDIKSEYLLFGLGYKF